MLKRGQASLTSTRRLYLIMSNNIVWDCIPTSVWRGATALGTNHYRDYNPGEFAFWPFDLSPLADTRGAVAIEAARSKSLARPHLHRVKARPALIAAHAMGRFRMAHSKSESRRTIAGWTKLSAVLY
jgi:hypothetical protein